MSLSSLVARLVEGFELEATEVILWSLVILTLRWARTQSSQRYSSQSSQYEVAML